MESWTSVLSVTCGEDRQDEISVVTDRETDSKSWGCTLASRCILMFLAALL